MRSFVNPLSLCLPVIIAVAVGLTAPRDATGQQPNRVADQATPANKRTAANKHSDLLADHRWQAPVHGLSLRPPAGVKQVEHTTDGSLVTFLAGSEYDLSVSIHYTKGKVDLKRVREAAFKQFGFAYPSRAQIINPPIEHSRRRRHDSLFVAAEDNQANQFIWGQFYLVMRPGKLAVLEVEADPDRIDHVWKVLGAVIDSIEIEQTKKLQARRRAELKAGQKWLDSISTRRIKAKLDRPDQLYRIVEGKTDIGYQRLHSVVDDQALASDDLGPGFALETQSRIVADQRLYDNKSSFYQSDKGLTEIWSRRTTLRKQAAMSGARTTTWTETGIRANDRITVTLNEPARLGANDSDSARTTKQTHHWPVPGTAYLSQADLYAIRAFYPSLGEQTVSFYAYDTKSQAVTLRSVSAHALDGGGHVVSVRPSPSSGKRTYVYDARGRLVQRRMADGRTFIRTTAQKLRQVWHRAPR